MTIPKSPTAAEIQHMAERFQTSSAQVVVVFATEGQLLELLSEVNTVQTNEVYRIKCTPLQFLVCTSQLAQRNVSGIQWVASEAWVTASLLTSPHFHALLEGTLGFSFPGATIPGLKEFLFNVRPSSAPGMEFVNMFWEELFGCRLEFGGAITTFRENTSDTADETVGLEVASQDSSSPRRYTPDEKPVCTGREDLASTDSSYTDIAKVRISYNVYKAVYAIAHALHTLLNCGSEGRNKGVCDKHEQFTSRQVSSHLKRLVNQVKLNYALLLCCYIVICTVAGSSEGS